MILDRIEHIDTYAALSKNFATAAQFLKQSDLSSLESNMVEIDGDSVYAVVTEKALTELTGSWEAHRCYADLHLVLRGQECFGNAPTAHAQSPQGYNEERDLEFYTDVDGTLYHLAPGDFAIVFPHDVHLPNQSTGQTGVTRKITLKIRLS